MNFLLYTEMKIYDKVINVIYDYEEKGINYAGTATLINADLEKALLFDYGFVEIRSDYKINILTPVKKLINHKFNLCKSFNL